MDAWNRLFAVVPTLTEEILDGVMRDRLHAEAVQRGMSDAVAAVWVLAYRGLASVDVAREYTMAVSS
jgi:hypothetical protein